MVQGVSGRRLDVGPVFVLPEVVRGAPGRLLDVQEITSQQIQIPIEGDVDASDYGAHHGHRNDPDDDS